MKKLKKADYIIMAILVVIIAGVVLIKILGSDSDSKGTGEQDTGNKKALVTSYKDFNGRPLGIKVGSSSEKITIGNYPDSEYFYYDGLSDLLTALLSGKIDGFMDDEPVIRLMCNSNPELAYYANTFTKEGYAFGFQKDTERSRLLIGQFNEMLKELWSAGEMDKLAYKWIEGPESDRVIEDRNLSGENGEISIATISDHAPFSYIKDNELCGYVIELCYMFAKKYGYSIHFEENKMSGLLAGLSTGKYDIGASSLSVTEERKTSIDFSDCIYNGGITLIVRAADTTGPEFVTSDTAASADLEAPYKKFNGKKIGILTGSSYEEPTIETFPDSEYMYFDTQSDMTLALDKGKIDGFITDEPVAKLACFENKNLGYYKNLIIEDNYCFGFNKDSKLSKKLREQFNEMINEMWSNGEIDRLIYKWTEGPEEDRKIDKTGLTGENGKILVGIVSDFPPFDYYYNNELSGLAVELSYILARRYGYNLEFEECRGAAVITGLTSGKYDVAAIAFSVTEERKKSMDFGDPFYHGGQVFMGRAEDIYDGNEIAVETTEKSFWEKLSESFERNFITENRWQLVLKGLGVTCLITVLSVLFGSVLAFLICMLRRVEGVLATGICNIFVKLLQGTPILVLLMILYYVIFGNSDVEAIWVAILAFTLNFGAYGSEIMMSGINSIDKGQREAALALGFTENQAFFRFIYPQAARRFLPVYKQEIISLLKNTSVVGYIAINDLTKVGDIIRSRTFEAFFPLIVSAIIYFIIAWIISILLKRVMVHMDPKHKKKAMPST